MMMMTTKFVQFACTSQHNNDKLVSLPLFQDNSGELVELGNLRASLIQFDSAEFRFDSLGAEAIYELWSALSNVLAKLLTVISLGLAVNAQ